VWEVIPCFAKRDAIIISAFRAVIPAFCPGSSGCASSTSSVDATFADSPVMDAIFWNSLIIRNLKYDSYNFVVYE
jgi:hypothetical protein